MRSWQLLLVLLCLAPLACNKQYKEEREKWGPSEWKDAVREDKQRVLTEDQRNKPLIPLVNKFTARAWDITQRLYNWIAGATPFDAAKGLVDPYYPDRRRQGVMWLSKHDYGRLDPYVKFYAEMGRNDDDFTVRAMAIRALNRSRARNYSALYIQALDDKSDVVRMEAAKALANMPEQSAVQPLLKHLNDPEENVDVRVACADALRLYHTSEVATALVGVLRDRQFAVSWQARWSLKLMTGRDYRYDPAAWLTYISSNERPFG